MEEKKQVPQIRFKGYVDVWEQRKLEDIVEFLDTLRKPLEGAKRVSGPYPYYGASGIVDYVDGYLFDEELVLLSEDGANITDRNYPVCFLASSKYWVNNHAHVLKVKNGNENNFICNSLERKDYTKYNTGMAMPKLNQETCRNIPVMCPGFEEQSKIGNYFRRLDYLITLHQRKYDKLVNIKKSMLEKMFPKNGSDVPEIRFKGFTDAWKQRKLGEITIYRNGTGHEEKQSESGKYELINLNSISIDGGLKPSGKFIDEETETLLKDDLVMVLSDVGHGDLLGRVAIILENNRFVLNQRVALLRNNSSVDIQYLFSYINAHQIYFKKQGAGSSQLNISRGSVENFEVLLPHKDEQKKIGNYLSSIDSLITLHQRKLEKLKNIKKSMLDKMFV